MLYPANSKLEYYTGQQKKFKLSNIGNKVKGYLPLKGSTSYEYLMLQLKKGSKKATISIQPIKKKFNFKYILTLGKGKYKVTIFGSNKNSGSYKGIGYFSVTNSKNIKPKSIEKKIIKYVNKTIGKKIGRGECWDIAQEALDYHGANWDRPTKFGLKINWKKDKVKPGDIIQFKTVKITTKLKNGTRTETWGAPDHTAIVAKVTGKYKYKVAHQNVGGSRIMQYGTLDLSGKVTGKIDFYRPIEGLIPVK